MPPLVDTESTDTAILVFWRMSRGPNAYLRWCRAVEINPLFAFRVFCRRQSSRVPEVNFIPLRQPLVSLQRGSDSIFLDFATGTSEWIAAAYGYCRRT